MKLVERASYLQTLQDRFTDIGRAGHTVFLMGEAGIGKTTLMTHFKEALGTRAHAYIGGCDSLFTPHPLGPLHDIAPQIDEEFVSLLRKEKERSLIFTALFERLVTSSRPVLLVIEDIHWADEATIDFIKFLSRRIGKLRCLFVLTMRDNELDARHPLKILFGQLAADTFTKVHLNALSREAVDEMARAKGHTSGDKVFTLTGGNPFYVTEVLATGMTPIPERIKDSVLTAFHSKDEHTQELWELLSVLPSRIEPSIVEKIEHEYPNVIESCLAAGVIVNRNDTLSFKHELYRIAIEESISKYRRRHLHQRVLRLLLAEGSGASLAQRVHHARFAEDHRLVLELAPRAAQEAAAVGAHMEAAKLYKTAIEHASADYNGMAMLYAGYAYECYLINQIGNAVIAQERCLALYREKGDALRTGDTLRFLSRLTWFAGNRGKASVFANESVEVLEQLPPARELAMAYSNFSQLNMLADNLPQTLHWGEKAIALAEQLNDPEILCHALNNVGSILLKTPGHEEEGAAKLEQSLSIALAKGYHEHAARAYTNMGSFYVLMKRYDKAAKWLDEGLRFCEEYDLLSWYYYMQGERTRLLVDTGAWNEAEQLALTLQAAAEQSLTRIGALVSLVRLNIRRGRFDDARQYLDTAKQLAAPTAEAYRILPIAAAVLELCWTSGAPVPREEIDAAIALLPDNRHSWHYAGVAYWMRRCGLPIADHNDVHYPGPLPLEIQGQFAAAAQAWKTAGCPFEQALALMDCDEDQQRAGLGMLDLLGATATSDMLKNKLREKGMRHIPRGPRESTRNNPAHLTGRQVEILALLEEGAQNKEIAEKLFISPKTVDHHISAILSKLSVNSRSKAVAEARKLGILK